MKRQQLQIDKIDSIDGFDRLKSDWEDAYAADPHGQIFLSWSWLRGWFAMTPYEWFVLAARSETTGRHVAFLPLAIRPIRSHGFIVRRDLHMGGKPLADYTGFVSLPEDEAAAVQMFASHIRSTPAWDRFHLADALDARVPQFLEGFSKSDFDIQAHERLSCPYLRLPGEWNRYLEDVISSNARSNLRRAFRRVEQLPGFRVTSPRPETLDNHIGALLTLWESRWGPRPEHIRNRIRQAFRYSFSQNALWLKLLWTGDTPVAGLGAFLDPIKRAFCYYIAGFNREFAKLSPGNAILGYSIRDAINSGFRTFDFLAGGEKYKLSFFNATERFALGATLTRKTFRAKFGNLYLRSRTWLGARRQAKAAAGG